VSFVAQSPKPKLEPGHMSKHHATCTVLQRAMFRKLELALPVVASF